MTILNTQIWEFLKNNRIITHSKPHYYYHPLDPRIPPRKPPARTELTREQAALAAAEIRQLQRDPVPIHGPPSPSLKRKTLPAPSDWVVVPDNEEWVVIPESGSKGKAQLASADNLDPIGAPGAGVRLPPGKAEKIVAQVEELLTFGRGLKTLTPRDLSSEVRWLIRDEVDRIMRR